MKNTRETFDVGIVASVVLHAVVVLALFVAPSLIGARTDTWGSAAGGNGGVHVKIVTSMPGIALPAPAPSADEGVIAKNESLHKAPEEKAKAPEKPDPDALKLSTKDKAVKPPKADKPTPAPTASANAAPPTASNAAAYGQSGGSPALRYGQTGSATGPTGAEIGGDGTFGDKYGFYVDAMTRAISNEWVKVAVTGTQRSKVYVTFTIARDGRISNLQIDPSSGPPASPIMERSALRAVQAAKLNPLPPDYRGSDVTVRFYFDYAR